MTSDKKIEGSQVVKVRKTGGNTVVTIPKRFAGLFRVYAELSVVECNGERYLEIKRVKA